MYIFVSIPTESVLKIAALKRNRTRHHLECRKRPTKPTFRRVSTSVMSTTICIHRHRKCLRPPALLHVLSLVSFREFSDSEIPELGTASPNALTVANVIKECQCMAVGCKNINQHSLNFITPRVPLFRQYPQERHVIASRCTPEPLG